MTTRADVERMASTIATASDQAKQQVSAIMSRLAGQPASIVRDALADAFPTLLAGFENVGTAAGLEFYDSMRARTRGLPAYKATAVAKPTPTAEAVGIARAAARHLFNPDLAPEVAGERTRRELSDALGTRTKNAMRQTIKNNAVRDPAKTSFARVPRGAKTCAFCTMLASRGFVYATAKTAGEDDKYHHDCDCMIVPSWDAKQAKLEGYDPDGYFEQYLKARRSLEAAGVKKIDAPAVTAQMRAMFPGEFTDSWTGRLKGRPKAEPKPKKPNESKQGEKAERKQKSKPVVFKKFASNEEGLQWARTKFPPVTASEDPTRAVFEYTSEAYRPWNTALREAKGKVPQTWATQTRALDALMDKHRIPEPVVLHRGTESSEFEFNGEQMPLGATVSQLQRLEGSIQTPHQYTSTSVGPKAVYDHKPVQIHFNVPQGTRAVNPMRIGQYGASEREIILHRGLKYRIDRVQKDKKAGKIHVFATILEEKE